MADAQYLLRFRDADGNPRDIEVTADSSGAFRFAIQNRSEVDPTYASVSGVAVDATATIYTSGVSVAEKWLAGIDLFADTDGNVTITLDGVKVGFQAINITQQSPMVTFPSPIYLPVGSTLIVSVVNVGVQAGLYEAVLYHAV